MDSAEFILFANIAYQCAGRGGEIAAIKYGDLSTFEIKEDNGCVSYNVIKIHIYRQKLLENCNLQIFPARDSILFDFYFTMGYFLTLSHHTSDNLLPTFNDQLKTPESGRVESDRVSKLFAKIMQRMDQSVQGYVNPLTSESTVDLKYGLEEWNPKLGSHAFRKESMNALAESAVPFYCWIHRCGLIMRNVHTLFDYISASSKRSDVINGNRLSGWPLGNGRTVYGGIPPSIRAINLNSMLPYLVSEYHFRSSISKGLKKEVAHLLFASILHNMDHFQSLMHDEPHGKFSHNRHPFLICLDETFQKCNVSLETISIWRHQISQQYVRDNILGLPLSKLGADGLGSVTIDAHTMTETIYELIHLSHTIRHQNHSLNLGYQNLQRQVQSEFNSLKQSVMEIRSILTSNHAHHSDHISH